MAAARAMQPKADTRQLPQAKVFQVWPVQWKTSISGKLAQHGCILEMTNLKCHCLKKESICFIAEVLQATIRPPVHSKNRIQGHQAKQRFIYIQGLDRFRFSCAKQRGFCPAAISYCSLTSFRQSSFNSLHIQSLLIHLTSSAEN